MSDKDSDSAIYTPATAPDVELLPPPTDVDQSHHARTRTGARAGYFCNPWLSWQSAALTDVAAALRKGAVLKEPPRDGQAEQFERNGRLVRVRRPDWRASAGEGGVRVCWLGHASVLVRVPRPRLGGQGEQGMVGVIFDPMFSKRCSPTQWFGPARYLDPPCSIEQLPPIHICCISHDHYDHLDYDSIIRLYRANDTTIQFFVPLGVKAWFLACGIPERQVTEMDWHQEAVVRLPTEDAPRQRYRDAGYPPYARGSMPGGYDSTSDDDEGELLGAEAYEDSPEGEPDSGEQAEPVRYEPMSLKVVCTPAQHRSGRGLFDQMKTLWASWIVGVVDQAEAREQGFGKGEPFKLFFGGDTGYRYAGVDKHERDRYICPAFEDIAQRYGPVSLALLPISTGSSLSFLRNLIGLSLHHYSLTSAQHSNAWDAIQIAKVLGAKRAVAIHHSTFSPEDESRGCVYEFVKIAEREGASLDIDDEGCFAVPDIGQVLEIK
ncbi:hypothetical protein NliqN6_2767 [Naganishia liquefaciens]|uniref:Metallo-beta-lactamase domain-containing protein n=1 Tax=Naganishia liquefaciens TaxID=104408 RepID=A0A8H3YEB2_9TREE|nr:hypothetical protein NliqN6_2767 [Naganishia liquefaciens]